MTLLEQFKQATDRLEDLVYREQKARQSLFDAEQLLVDSQAQKILDGSLVGGKNETERQAKLTELTRQEIGYVRAATEAHSEIKAKLRGAELQHQYFRYALKLEIGVLND